MRPDHPGVPRTWWVAVGVAAALVAEVAVVSSLSADRPVVGSLPLPAQVHRSAAAMVASLVERAPRAPRVELVAAVTDGGAPVAGARVSIGDGSGPVSRTAVTDERGVARFDDLEPGPYQLWASRGDRVSDLSRLATTGDARVSLALGPGTPLSGRAQSSEPLGPGARAVLIPVGLDHAVVFADLDREGRFAVDALPRGRWRLRLAADDHVAAREVLFTAADERVVLEVQLRPTGRVTGQVLDSSGAPVAGATVVVHRRGERAIGAAADWALSPAGIRWVHPLAVERHMPMRDARRFGARRPGARPPECGGGHCGVDIGVDLGSVVHAAAAGRVVAVVHDARRLAGRYIAIEHDFGLKSFYMHLDEIRFDLEVGQRVGAGEPIGTLGASGTGHFRPHLHFSVSREIDGRPHFIDPEPMLHHAVVLPEPGSVARPATRVAAASPERSAAPARALDRIVTGADGGFEVADLPSGSYVATAYHPERAPGTSAGFAVRSGQVTGGVRIELADGVVFYGQVRAGDQPIAGARILAEEGRGESRRVVARATTDASGRYQLRPLAGSVALRALSPEHGEAEKVVAATGAGRREVSFELAILDGEIAGRVLDHQARPLPGATVRLIDGPPSATRQILTDASGRFAIRATAGGRYRLEVAAAEHPQKTLTVHSDRPATIALDAAGTISAEVRDAHTRQPVAGVELLARGPGEVRRRVVTGDRGIAVIPTAVTGTWRLSIRAPGYTPLSRTVVVSAGRRSRPDLALARGAILEGVLRDSDGVRIAGATVRVGPVSTTTDGDGNFRITGAPTGPVEIRGEKGEATGALSLELAPGDELVTLELRIE